MNKIICDICGREQKYKYEYRWMVIDVNGPVYVGEKDHFDICPDCASNILKNIENSKSSNDDKKGSNEV